MMRGSAICSSLCHPGFHRQGRHSPAVQHCRATLEASGGSLMRTTSKAADDFDGRNPFNPPLKPSYCPFETAAIALVLTVAMAISIAMMCAAFDFGQAPVRYFQSFGSQQSSLKVVGDV
jgi:hypothetical protein